MGGRSGDSFRVKSGVVEGEGTFKSNKKLEC